MMRATATPRRRHLRRRAPSPPPAKAAATPDDDDAALNRAEADARDQEGDGRSDDGEDHKAPLVLREEVTPPTTTHLYNPSPHYQQHRANGRRKTRLGLQIDPLPSANPSKRCSRPVRKVLKND